MYFNLVTLIPASSSLFAINIILENVWDFTCLNHECNAKIQSRYCKVKLQFL